MSARKITIFCCALLIAASSALAISPGADLLIAGAARTRTWDCRSLYQQRRQHHGFGHGVLARKGSTEPQPTSRTFSIGADDTLILDDVLLKNFGMNNAAGAFRITVIGGEVTANLLVFTGFNDPVGGTYGSGFEAIPASSATRAGEIDYRHGSGFEQLVLHEHLRPGRRRRGHHGPRPARSQWQRARHRDGLAGGLPTVAVVQDGPVEREHLQQRHPARHRDLGLGGDPGFEDG